MQHDAVSLRLRVALRRTPAAPPHKPEDASMELHATTPPPPEGCIETQVVGNVLLIGLNRPAKRNGWTPRMFRELGEAYTPLWDPGLKVHARRGYYPRF